MSNTTKNATHLTDHRLLRLSEIICDKKKGMLPIIPVSRSTWLIRVKEGRYPQPVKLGRAAVAWRESDVLALLGRLSNAIG